MQTGHKRFPAPLRRTSRRRNLLIRDVIIAKPGMSILIHGAAGGVGAYTSQIGRNPRARVIGTATGADLEYLKSVGVDDVIDYTRERF